MLHNKIHALLDLEKIISLSIQFDLLPEYSEAAFEKIFYFYHFCKYNQFFEKNQRSYGLC